MTNTDDLATRIRVLDDIEAIRQLKHRLLHGIDNERWEQVRDCLAPDATSDEFGDPPTPLEGADAIVAFLSGRAPGLEEGGIRSFHLAHHPEIDITSEREARATWSLHYFEFDTEAKTARQQAAYHFDAYVKQGDAWKLGSTGLVNLFDARWDAPDLAFVETIRSEMEENQ